MKKTAKKRAVRVTVQNPFAMTVRSRGRVLSVSHFGKLASIAVVLKRGSKEVGMVWFPVSSAAAVAWRTRVGEDVELMLVPVAKKVRL